MNANHVVEATFGPHFDFDRYRRVRSDRPIGQGGGKSAPVLPFDLKSQSEY
jgi:hypothetical protein